MNDVYATAVTIGAGFVVAIIFTGIIYTQWQINRAQQDEDDDINHVVGR